ncbi:MAG: MBOAT family O-acyltransferase, partial [Synergistaceae bacterium]|nr:MBOAT family O-acyltransferase [Synergistaceae bacterium]
PVAYHWTSLILAAIAYSLQIYFDFSGYSDIAIGCAKCFGYDFLPNFNLPYISRNITEFWRRWHLSLSTWLKEYLYIPLGGNRKGKARMYANLLITMLLGGLWHGADWTFVAWGGMHGIALCIDKLRSHKHDDVFIVKYIGTIITYLFVVFAWIFFRAENFSNAWQIIAGILSMQQGIVQNFSWVYISIVILSVASVLAVHKAKLDREDFVRGYYPTVNLNTVKGLSLFLIFLGLTVGLAYTGGSPFVYFQF